MVAAQTSVKELSDGSVKVGEAFSLIAYGMRVHHIEEHPKAVSMSAVDQVAEIVWGTKAA